MPVQQILDRNGVLVGYQARWRGKSRYFAAGKYGPHAVYRAFDAERQFIAADPSPSRRKVQRNNRSSVPGIRLMWVANVSGPVQYVQASWTDAKGRPRSTAYSTERNGRLKATELAIAARERGGERVGLSARQVWARIARGDAS